MSVFQLVRSHVLCILTGQVTIMLIDNMMHLWRDSGGEIKYGKKREKTHKQALSHAIQ